MGQCDHRAMLPAAVSDILQSAADIAILPRFRKLTAGEVIEKAKDEIVTIADREAEQLIEAQLLKLLPGSRVVGEEACAADPHLLERLDNGDVWLVDPLDGTANFVAGRPVFASMVALLRDGEAVAAWVFNPVTRDHWQAERGGGTRHNGVAVQCRPSPGPLRGAVLTRFLPADLRERIEARRDRVGEMLPGLRCAGVEYPALITNEQQFALFWRTLPWDHVPGTLLVTEAGGHVARLDGTPYRAADDTRGLLAAASKAQWDAVRDALLAD